MELFNYKKLIRQLCIWVIRKLKKVQLINDNLKNDASLHSIHTDDFERNLVKILFLNHFIRTKCYYNQSINQLY